MSREDKRKQHGHYRTSISARHPIQVPRGRHGLRLYLLWLDLLVIPQRVRLLLSRNFPKTSLPHPPVSADDWAIMDRVRWSASPEGERLP